MCFLTLETRIPSDMQSPTWETHIPSDMCFPTWETHMPSDMCSPTWETHIPNDMGYFYNKGMFHTYSYIHTLFTGGS